VNNCWTGFSGIISIGVAFYVTYILLFPVISLFVTQSHYPTIQKLILPSPNKTIEKLSNGFTEAGSKKIGIDRIRVQKRKRTKNKECCQNSSTAKVVAESNPNGNYPTETSPAVK
jgi:hypothetical protein